MAKETLEIYDTRDGRVLKKLEGSFGPIFRENNIAIDESTYKAKIKLDKKLRSKKFNDSS